MLVLVPVEAVAPAQPGRPVLDELLAALFVEDEFNPVDEPCGCVCGGSGDGDPGVGAAGLPVTCGLDVEALPLADPVVPVPEPGAPVEAPAPPLAPPEAPPEAPPPLCAKAIAVVAAKAAAISGSVRCLACIEILLEA